jgi:3D (Asp-Asp-Asp) domain-containing protein
MLVTNILTAFITAYVATGNPTATGIYPQTHHTVAIPRRYPLGCDVFICGESYKGEDRTARKYDGRFDIFMSSRKAALKWGKQKHVVVIIYDDKSQK